MRCRLLIYVQIPAASRASRLLIRECPRSLTSGIAAMRVRIRRVPPSPALEGVDLRPYSFREGRLYELDPPVARVLLSWGYADRHPKPEVSNLPQPARACSKCG